MVEEATDQTRYRFDPQKSWSGMLPRERQSMGSWEKKRNRVEIKVALFWWRRKYGAESFQDESGEAS